MSEFAFTINCYLVVVFLAVSLYYIDRCDVLFLREEVILMIYIKKGAINNVFEAIYKEIRSGKHVIITDAALKRLWEKTRTVEGSLLRRSIINKTHPNGDREFVPLAKRVVFMNKRERCAQLDKERNHRFTTVLSFCSKYADWEVEIIPIRSPEGSPTDFFVAGIHRKGATEPWTNIPWASDWNTTGFLAGSEQRPVVVVLP